MEDAHTPTAAAPEDVCEALVPAAAAAAAAPSPAEPATVSRPPKKRCIAASKIEDEPSRKQFRVRLQNGSSKGFPYGSTSRTKALQDAKIFMYENSSDWKEYVDDYVE